MSEVKKLRLREDIPSGYKWNIEKIYKDSTQWEEEFENLKGKSKSLLNFQGTLKDKENLKAYLSLDEDLSRTLEKLYVFAHMKSHEDTQNAKFQSLASKIDVFMAEFSSYTAFFVPEILSLDENEFFCMIDNDKDLKLYDTFFKTIFKEKPHILSKEVEEVIASVSNCLGSSESIFSILTNADMSFGTIKDEEGNLIELSEGNYSNFIKSKNKDVRKSAFELLFGTYKKYEKFVKKAD